MSLIKTITIDGFYTPESARDIAAAVFNLSYQPSEFGKEIPNFNMVPQDADRLFSTTLKLPLTVLEDVSGVFRIPELFIHFENFTTINDWLFVVALQESTFNVFEHTSGATTALEGHDFKYRNLFEWNLMVNYLLKPGQGVLFRPWLFHSFDNGLIQSFRLQETTDATAKQL